MLVGMRRIAWPLASALLVLSACNALTGASDLSTCPSCDEVPGLDASVASEASLPEAAVLDGTSDDAHDAATTIDASTDADADADADAGVGCLGAVACTRVVFVTSLDYTGNLGGVAGADAKCQALADTSTIARIRGRRFLAWVSTTMTSPSSRLVHGTQPYIRPDSVTIAANWSDLTNGTLQNGISLDENGGTHGGGAWTATSSVAALYTGTACADWTSILFGAQGGRGNVGGSGSGWSGGGTDDCLTVHSLYCFEQ